MEYESVIGIEVHTELKTRTKMFCDSLNDPDEKHPNVHVCPICLAHPGTLPTINKEAVEKVLLLGLALHAEIPEFSQFDRKNYFYPDLPKGYQISQYEHPLVKGGYLEFKNFEGAVRHIRITRVHLEEDTGRLVHDALTHSSLVDFNRAGMPLMELVTEPDIRTADEARRFAEELQLIIRYVGASDADMEKGQMRVEANVSLRGKGTKEFGTKVELKNINSPRFVAKAIEYEIDRQKKILDEGGTIVQETRGWDDEKGVTFEQRLKEGATDYRYFPEPDLPPLLIDQAWLQSIRAKLPELPSQKRVRFEDEYQLDEKTIELFIRDSELAEYFEDVISEMSAWVKSMGDRVDRGRAIKLAANYLTGDFQKLRKETVSAIHDILITPANFGELMALIYEAKISSAAAKIVLEEMFRRGTHPETVIREKNLLQENSAESLREVALKTLAENPDLVASVRAGKTNAIQVLIGAALKTSGGRGNPARLRSLIEEAINQE